MGSTQVSNAFESRPTPLNPSKMSGVEPLLVAIVADGLAQTLCITIGSLKGAGCSLGIIQTASGVGAIVAAPRESAKPAARPCSSLTLGDRCVNFVCMIVSYQIVVCDEAKVPRFSLEVH
jgi:hypothetical protein